MATMASQGPEPSVSKDCANHLPSKSYANTAKDDLENGHISGDRPPKPPAGGGKDAAPCNSRLNMHQKSGSWRMNGQLKDDKSSGVVIERYQDKEGEHLVSFGPDWENQRNKQFAARRRNSELLSGRKAGARWEKSQYDGDGSYEVEMPIDKPTAFILPPSLYL